MHYLLRLDLERLRRNLSQTTTSLVTEDDLYRLLTTRGVWRHSDEWWGATEASLQKFGEGEILERRTPS